MNIIDQAIKLLEDHPEVDRERAYTSLTAYLYDSRSVGETLQDDKTDLEMLTVPLDDPDWEAIADTGEHLESAEDVMTVLRAWSKALADDPSIDFISDLPEVELPTGGMNRND